MNIKSNKHKFLALRCFYRQRKLLYKWHGAITCFA